MNTIEIKNLNKKIKGAEVLKDINLHLEGGKVYGLKGKNGSGKTMLMRAVCGLILPTGGSITINGEQLGKQISFPRSVGILIENPSFIPGYTGLKNLSVLAAIQKRVGEDEIRETLEKIGLDPDDKRTHKNHRKVRLIERAGTVAYKFLGILYVGSVAHHREPVAHLQHEVGGGKKHHAAAQHTRHRDAERVAQTQRAKTLAVDFRTRHDDVARHELTVKLVPIHMVVPVAVLAFSEKDCECLHVFLRSDNEYAVAFLKGDTRRGHYQFFGAPQT
jgi:ABC-type glutathione transport system ATPase component